MSENINKCWSQKLQMSQNFTLLVANVRKKSLKFYRMYFHDLKVIKI